MLACPECSRFIRSDASRCPFCAAPQRNTMAMGPAIAGVLLGLTLVACGDDSTGENTSSPMTMGDSTVTETPTDGTTVGMSSMTGASTTASSMGSSSGMTTTTAGSTSEAEVSAYGGPGLDTMATTGDGGDTDQTESGSTTGEGTGE